MRPLMREALEMAARSPLRRVHDQEHGSASWPAHSASLAALVRRGYLERTVLKTNSGVVQDVWSITEEGKQALKPARLVGSERPVFMARGSGVTSERAMAIDDAEVMGAPSEAWLRVARERRAGVEDPRRAAKRLARSLRAA